MFVANFAGILEGKVAVPIATKVAAVPAFTVGLEDLY